MNRRAMSNNAILLLILFIFFCSDSFAAEQPNYVAVKSYSIIYGKVKDNSCQLIKRKHKYQYYCNTTVVDTNNYEQVVKSDMNSFPNGYYSKGDVISEHCTTVFTVKSLNDHYPSRIFSNCVNKECVTFRLNGEKCYILETEVKKVKNTPLVEADQDK